MNNFKLETFKRQFPFLTEMNNDFNHCDKITVKRVDCNLLETKPYIDEVIGSLVGIHEGTIVTFYDKDFALIKVSYKSEYSFKSNYAHEDPCDEDGETILEIIFKNKIVKKIEYIMIENFGYNVVNHHSQDNFSIDIYKSSINCDISKLIDKELEEANKKVKAECNF